MVPTLSIKWSTDYYAYVIKNSVGSVVGAIQAQDVEAAALPPLPKAEVEYLLATLDSVSTITVNISGGTFYDASALLKRMCETELLTTIVGR